MSIAETIASQIGNPAFVMMGAYDLVGCDRSLTFKIRGSRVKAIKVKLMADDTYSVAFWAGPKFTLLANVDGVYVDSLHAVISERTGLALSLGRAS